MLPECVPGSENDMKYRKERGMPAGYAATDYYGKIITDKGK